ncbi:pentatricopeptide repeat-containing protein At3g14580, mitochondrial [Mercurialis annua]|uniref:pentatricopeptide repeat-containing protein At3g14580, mitochondrial n=1 Tax=Mercurialis annua TaxID=3986 RepID=UPI002160628A|nr:pentatricopeptide repeat-containing protein At3g14580, mitochondrial [Mercurialis annua]
MLKETKVQVPSENFPPKNISPLRMRCAIICTQEKTAMRKSIKMLSRLFLAHNTEFLHCRHKFKLQTPLFLIPNYFTSFSTSPSSLDPHSKLTHRDWLSATEVIRIFENIQDPNSVLPLWKQYTTRKDYKPNEPLYTLVINYLSKAKNFDAIEDIMRRIKLDKNSCRLSNDFFYNVIKIYGQLAGRIRKGIDTLFDMPKGYNCWPNVKTFNLVLNLLVSARIFDVVHEIYVKAPVLGVEIDACCLNILMKGLCENGDLEGAFQVLDEFPKQRCKPNVRTFSTLMHYLCAKADVNKAFGLLERMEIEEIEVDTITYNILISGLRKQGRIDEGIELLREMKMKGNEPNAGSYQEVLYGLLDVGRLVEAKELIGRMVREGNSPGFVSYKKLIDGLCKGKLIKDIDWALKQMLRQGFVPKMGMWKQIVGCVVSESNASSSIYISQIIGG